MDLVYGSYMQSVDASGRFVVPLEFRNFLGDSCVIMKGVGCLWLMRSELAESIKLQLQQKANGQLASMFNSKVSVLARHLYSGMSECVFDKNGRIALSQEQRQYTKITSSAKLCGVGGYIEIWNPTTINEISKQYETNEELLEIADLLFENSDDNDHVQLS
ncbi:MAG: hypothetical protein KBT47_06500 [Armatimonadetes bacterium]|nr:hypothetical protein [Candidatus Hippobium faecium]